MLGAHENTDRRTAQPDLEPLDALMLTLDAEKYLEETLDAAYREVPINRFFVIDGGSKDRTIDILRQYPRMEIHIRPDIRTTGKGMELLLKMATTPWVIFVDCGKVPAEGWYDEMAKYKDRYDLFGSRRVLHYEFEREDPRTTDLNARPLGGPWLMKLESLKGYHVDDDYAWRMVDRLLRQVVEKNGCRYGAVRTTYHVCHVSDHNRYESDKKKSGTRLVFQPPAMEITNPENWEQRLENARRGIVKYLDPDFCPDLRNDASHMDLAKLDMDWIRSTNPKWFDELKEFQRKRYAKVVLKTVYRETRRLVASVKKALSDYLTGLASLKPH